MYSQESIDILTNRVGWSELSSDHSIVLTSDNKTATSGKTFDWYHSLILIDSIYAAVPMINMPSVDFNNYLSELRKNAVKNVLSSILDSHIDYDPLQDYSSILIGRSILFDDAIGYTVAIKMIELFISTTRKNFQERNAKMSYQSLKIELEGARNDNGHFIAKGIVFKRQEAIKKAQKIIFPKEIVVQNGNAW